MLLFLLACAPEPGEVGSHGCEAQYPGERCTVWECWEVEPDATRFWYAWGWDDSEEKFANTTGTCADPSCMDKLFQQAVDACGSPLGTS